MEIVFVTFESAPRDDEFVETVRSRADRFRSVEEHVQKFYLLVGEGVGRLYSFDSEKSRAASLESARRASIGDADAVTGTPAVSTHRLLFPLRETEGCPAPA